MSGGAYIAAKRQCDALNSAGVECSLLAVEHDWSIEATQLKMNSDSGQPTLYPMMRKYKFADQVAEIRFERHRTPMSNSPMSLWRINSETNQALIDLIHGEAFTHVHFHLAPQLVNSQLLEQLKQLDIPTFITCHDMFYFTGGCHYSANCERFTTSCNYCPQLNSDGYKLIHHAFNEKLAAFDSSHANFIFPSQWLHDEFARSAIGAKVAPSQCHTIRNCLDQSYFIPARVTKVLALRKEFGIPEDNIVIIAGAMDNTEKRKGYSQLKATLLATSNQLTQANSARRITLLTFGANDESKSISTPYISQLSLGSLTSSGVRDAMQCADVLLFTSTQDNYPNIVLEAIHCGTLVLATDSGGTKELLTDKPHATINTGSMRSDCYELAKILSADELNTQVRQAKIPSRQFLHNNAPSSVAQELSSLYRNSTI